MVVEDASGLGGADDFFALARLGVDAFLAAALFFAGDFLAALFFPVVAFFMRGNLS